MIKRYDDLHVYLILVLISIGNQPMFEETKYDTKQQPNSKSSLEDYQ